MPKAATTVPTTVPTTIAAAIQSQVFEPYPSRRQGVVYLEGLPYGLSPIKLDKHHWLCPAAYWTPAPCYRVFKSSANAKDHYQKHLGLRLLCETPGCGASYSDRPALHKHMVKDHGYIATGAGGRSKDKKRKCVAKPKGLPQVNSGHSTLNASSSSHSSAALNTQPQRERASPPLYPLVSGHSLPLPFPGTMQAVTNPQYSSLPIHGACFPWSVQQSPSPSTSTQSNTTTSTPLHTPTFEPRLPLPSLTSTRTDVDSYMIATPFSRTALDVSLYHHMTFDALMDLFEPIYDAEYSGPERCESAKTTPQHTDWGLSATQNNSSVNTGADVPMLSYP
ncbi:hypothetical protein CONPUDRAFT_158521 [Coniophora puteana RWD-64-598 SS2]|uniref:C2H2-type domain-containing protein n=1 Tax=Coniophora puteana (strain RWD-64-598) TaxID=741705 RepID=A0A5M3MBP6_CONPW|nr:uncharacterized protein CONPUDRAFT_158521 [Coniophora puteana RWD-64-598 SS2]EIW76503.1 hypothetical protein CONPUDRAFT_158521 [Coniophora puteana RWD-64-598 SS2]